MYLNPQMADRRVSRWQRQTMWPSALDLEDNAPPANDFGPERGWRGGFDSEARASRLSFFAGDTLLPPAPRNEARWHGQERPNRATWMSFAHAAERERPVWEGSFDVEKRASWISRTSDRWSESFDLEKENLKARDPITQEQLDQAKGPLVTKEILTHHFEGSGTESDPYLVQWIENDSGNPLEFSTQKKWTNAIILAFAVFIVSIASSGFSQGKWPYIAF